MSLVYVFFFFFSSRRRHTRFDCDWSSDVCSSDLRVTVMRDGQVVATRMIGSTSEQELTRLMVGREVNLRVDKSNQKPGEPTLQIKELRVADETGREKIR